MGKSRLIIESLVDTCIAKVANQLRLLQESRVTCLREGRTRDVLLAFHTKVFRLQVKTLTTAHYLGLDSCSCGNGGSVISDAGAREAVEWSRVWNSGNQAYSCHCPNCWGSRRRLHHFEFFRRLFWSSLAFCVQENKMPSMIFSWFSKLCGSLPAVDHCRQHDIDIERMSSRLPKFSKRWMKKTTQYWSSSLKQLWQLLSTIPTRSNVTMCDSTRTANNSGDQFLWLTAFGYNNWCQAILIEPQ